MKLLELESDLTARPAPELLEVEDFRVLQKALDDPEQFVRALAFIYHMESHGSPYSAYQADLRLEKVTAEVLGEYAPLAGDQVVIAARKKYVELTETAAIRLLKSANTAIHKLTDYFDTINLTETDDHGKLVYSSKDVVANISNLGKVIEGLTKLQEQVEKEQQVGVRNRAGVKTNRFSS